MPPRPLVLAPANAWHAMPCKVMSDCMQKRLQVDERDPRVYKMGASVCVYLYLHKFARIRICLLTCTFTTSIGCGINHTPESVR